MKKTLRLIRWLMALLTAAVCLLLCWQVIDIYLAGNRPENFSAPGVRIAPVYSRQIAAERLHAVAPALLVYAVAAVLALILQAVFGDRARPRIQKPVPQPREAPRWLRPALYIAAIALVAFGILNGGARDVLVKAVNICTECIGLG